jgi:hypothetical protein
MVISPTHCAALSTVFFSPDLLDNIVGLADLVLVYAQNLVSVCALTRLFAILPSSRINPRRCMAASSASEYV